ncbi:hypothetical protein [Streptomyces phaeochromogenes]
MTQLDTHALGRAAYAAYGKAVGGDTPDGPTMIAWEDLGDTMREAWAQAAREAVRAAFTLPVTVIPDTPSAPFLGAYVLVAVDPAMNNGSNIAPAIVTRCWGGTSINVRVLLDSEGVPLWRTSLTYADMEFLGFNGNKEREYRWTWPSPLRP